MDTALRILRLLADGRSHSGTELGERLGISRAAVWKHIRRLQEWGVPVHSQAGRGYRLHTPLELLDEAELRSHLAPATTATLHAIQIHPHLDSTNSHLARHAPWPGPTACLAEVQSAGRGRRGRTWHTPLGGGLALSLAWPFPERPAALETLALRTALAVAEALESLGLNGVGLKWPNDLLVEGRKLAGILIELEGEWGGPYHAVVGVGVNVHLPEGARRAIDRPHTDLHTLMGAACPGRNRLAAALLDHLCAALTAVQADVDDHWHSRWAARELYRGRPVRLLQENGEIHGIHRGIAADGALLLETDQGLRPYYAGEVSLRAHHPETTP